MHRLDPANARDRRQIARNAAAMGLILSIIAALALALLAARHPFVPLRIAGGIGAVMSIYMAVYYGWLIRAARKRACETSRAISCRAKENDQR